MQHSNDPTRRSPARPPATALQHGWTARRSATPAYDDALLVVDVQRDFLPGGALAVPQGDRVIDPINRVVADFARRERPVFASRDWHPRRHLSFAEQGGPWPPHCIAGTEGAAFAEALRLPPRVGLVSKATRAELDAYSAFQGTDLAPRLQDRGIRTLVVCGLATDYCVLHSVLDALAHGFAVTVLSDAVAAVDVAPGDGEKALESMRLAGASVVDSHEWEARQRLGREIASPPV